MGNFFAGSMGEGSRLPKLRMPLVLERLPKSVKRFSDKRRGENKELEQERDSEIAHSALTAHSFIMLLGLSGISAELALRCFNQKNDTLPRKKINTARLLSQTLMV